MESAQTSEMDLGVAIVLSAQSSRGHRVQLLECRDGSFVITCDGEKQDVFQAGPSNLESWIRSYLAILGALAEGLPGPFLSSTDA